MTEVVLSGPHAVSGVEQNRRKALRRFMLAESTFRTATFSAAMLVLVLLGGVILSLVIGSIPAIRQFGFGFLTTQSWNPVTEKFGAIAPIYGTIVTSIIAMVIGIPVSLRHRHLPHRALPLSAAPADRHRHRAARRHPVDHLRHLGPVRPRALPAGRPCSHS